MPFIYLFLELPGDFKTDVEQEKSLKLFMCQQIVK